ARAPEGGGAAARVLVNHSWAGWPRGEGRRRGRGVAGENASKRGGEAAVTAIPDIMLNNGRTIPQFGFGVFLVKPEDTVRAVSTALQAGYRHIDTAQMYGNEKEVGEAIARSGIDRGEVFVTSKLANGSHLPDDPPRAFDAPL